MKFTIEKKEAIRLLDAVGAGRAPGAHRYEACVLLRTAEVKGKACVWMARRDVLGSAVISGVAQGITAGKALTDAKDLGDKIKAMPEGHITIGVDGSVLAITSDSPRRRFTQGLVSPEEFGKIEEPARGTVRMPASVAKQIQDATGYLTGRADATRGAFLKAVRVWIKDGWLSAMALGNTSSRALRVKVDLPDLAPMALTPDLLAAISADATLAIETTPKIRDGQPAIGADGAPLMSTHQVHVWSGSLRVSRLMPDGVDAPEELCAFFDGLPSEHVATSRAAATAEDWIRMPRALLLDAVKALAGTDKTGGVDISWLVGVSVARLREQGPDGEADADVPSDHTANRNVILSDDTLARALATMTCDEIDVCVRRPLEPVLVCPAGADRSSMLAMLDSFCIMPMSRPGASS